MASSSPSPTSLSLSLDSLLSSHRFPSPSSLSFPKSHFPIKSLPTQTPPTPTPTPTPFLDPTTLHRIQTLTSFHLTHHLPSGASLHIRPMGPQELDPTITLLAESFAESSWMSSGYAKLLEFLIKQYVVERRNLVPHAVMLVGVYKEEESEGELACTAEVSFDARGVNKDPPTPVAPRNCPYVCNMTVKKKLRRKGIGRQLLRACEELISQMKTIRKVYLHCRLIDTGPFEMYTKAGYSIVQTDSMLILLSLQRRKHLMCKELPPLVDSQFDTSDDEATSDRSITKE